MSKIRVGNKENAVLNGALSRHVRNQVGGKLKRYTSSVRRQRGLKLTEKALEEMYN